MANNERRQGVPGRPPVEQRRIVAELLQEIRDGTLARGSRLPSQEELARRFGVTKVTVTTAMRLLAEAGFISAGPRGSHVALRFPADNTYGVLFPRCPQQLAENAFWTALHATVVGKETQPANAVLRPYYVEEYQPLRQSPDYLRLQQDIELNGIRGLIAISPPTMLVDSPCLYTGGLGYAGIFLPDPHWSQFMGLRLRHDCFGTKALDHLANRNRRRVANLLMSRTGEEHVAQLAKEMQARGMAVHDRWQIALDTNPVATCWAGNYVQLLFHSDDRPDALIIWDDNLVHAVTKGLLAAGIRVPEDVEIVAHCNYPVITTSVVPATRLGYDACEVLQKCVTLIERQLAGDNAGTILDIEPVFDFERNRT